MTYTEHFQLVSVVFSCPGGLCWALCALCSLQGCCEGCTRQGYSRAISAGLMLLQEALLLRECLGGTLFGKGFSPLCLHVGIVNCAPGRPQQREGAKLM